MDCQETLTDLSDICTHNTVEASGTDTVQLSDDAPPTDPIGELVKQALFRQQNSLNVRERRREQRQPYPYAVYLSPLSPRGEAQLAETFVVIGKHLSPHGFDFYHSQPVPYRRVLASFDCGGGRWIAFVLDLGWCRFNRNGWYDNGGRFLEVASSPFNQWNLPEDCMTRDRQQLRVGQLRSESVA